MIVNTQRLFGQLLGGLQINTVCDVGSMNGAEALSFSATVPHSRIYAFEPNPRNFALMRTNERLQHRNIELLPWAASNYDGEGVFHLVEADYSRRDPRRGMSSLYQRLGEGEWASVARVPVRVIRLDSFLASRGVSGARVALWIDTEGSAYEVIEGLAGVAARVQLLHVEVETAPCIGAQQKLYPQVRALLARLGFAQLATDQPLRSVQFNALFVRAELAQAQRRVVGAWLWRARARHLTGSALRRLCPACLRRYQALRRRAH
jgi:FkbM family methyltransferase